MKADRNKIEKNRELIAYIFVGASTTILNLLLFRGLLYVHLNYRIANLSALICSKIYGYVGNKQLVFKTRCATIKDLLYEMVKYTFTRGFTGFLDYFGLVFAVEFLRYDIVLSKYALQAAVIILNYVLGKFIVFHSDNDKTENA